MHQWKDTRVSIVVFVLERAATIDLPLRVHFGWRDASVLLSEFDNLVDVSGGLHVQLGHSWQSDLCALSSYIKICQLGAQQIVYWLVVDLHHRRLQRQTGWVQVTVMVPSKYISKSMFKGYLFTNSFFHSFITRSFTHSFTDSFIHWFIHSLIHSFTYSPIHSLTHSFLPALSHSLIHHSLIHSFIHWFIHSLIHSFILSSIHSLIHSFIHSSIHSLTHPFIHSFIPSRTQSFNHSLIHSLMLTYWCRGEMLIDYVHVKSSYQSSHMCPMQQKLQLHDTTDIRVT